MRRIDELYTQWPFYGTRKITEHLKVEGQAVNRKRVSRLMRLMGIEAIYQKPRTTKATPEHRKYPYLLRGLEIAHPNQVWATDISVPQISGVRDGGRPPGAALQGEASNHRRRPWSKALVVSATEKVQRCIR